MAAGFYRTQNGSFISPKIIGIHFTFTVTKIPVDNLLTKVLTELPSIEQISLFTETSRLVPLIYALQKIRKIGTVNRFALKI